MLGRRSRFAGRFVAFSFAVAERRMIVAEMPKLTDLQLQSADEAVARTIAVVHTESFAAIFEHDITEAIEPYTRFIRFLGAGFPQISGQAYFHA